MIGVEGSLKGWDFSIAITEGMLNTAMERMVDRHLVRNTLPRYEESAVELDTPYMKQKNTVGISGLKIGKLRLYAVPENNNGRLEVTFAAGKLYVQKEIEFKMPNVPNPPAQGMFQKQLNGVTLQVNVQLRAYKLNLRNQSGNKYDIQLEIVGRDAIVGSLMWNLGMVSYIGLIREGLTEKLKETLSDKSKFDLGTFDVPKRTTGRSIVKELFPEQLRFAVIYNPSGSIITAFGSSNSNLIIQENAFNWNKAQLLPRGHIAATIASEKIMQSLVPAIRDNIPKDTAIDVISSGGQHYLKLRHRVNDVWQSTDIKSLTLKTYSRNEMEIKMNLFDHVSKGITVDIYITVRMSLLYNRNNKEFQAYKTYQSHHTDYHKDWWIVLLEVLTLGITSLVVEIIKIIANGEIANAISGTFNFSPAHGGLPLNVGGVLGEVINSMSVHQPFWNNGNFVIPFDVNWQNVNL